MPTLNPRVNVTLSPSLDLLVSQLAGFERISKSMVLRELLEAAEPALRQAVALMEAAKGATIEARKKLVESLDTSIKEAENTSSQMLQYLNSQTQDMIGEAEAIRGRRPQRAGVQPASGPRPLELVQSEKASNAVKGPPISNRGVKTQKTHKQTPDRVPS